MPKTHRRQVRKHKVLIVDNKQRPKIVDRLTFIVAIVEPLIALPQAITIFQRHNATGISLSTWLGFCLLDAVWVWYSIEHRERLIFIESTLFLIVQSAIVAGGAMYGAQW